jgi:hypothetical protein
VGQSTIATSDEIAPALEAITSDVQASCGVELDE